MHLFGAVLEGGFLGLSSETYQRHGDVVRSAILKRFADKHPAGALKVAEPEIMRCVTKGILKKNTASRKVARLAKRVNALKAA